MSLTPATDRELAELIDRWHLGDLDEDARAQLVGRMENDPAVPIQVDDITTTATVTLGKDAGPAQTLTLVGTDGSSDFDGSAGPQPWHEQVVLALPPDSVPPLFQRLNVSQIP